MHENAHWPLFQGLLCSNGGMTGVTRVQKAQKEEEEEGKREGGGEREGEERRAGEEGGKEARIEKEKTCPSLGDVCGYSAW